MKPYRFRHVLAYLILPAVLLSAGCSTTNTGSSLSSSLRKADISYSVPDSLRGEAIPVLIHYPALIDPGAFQTTAGHYGGNAIELPGEEQGSYSANKTGPFLKEAINKTEYLALEFYRLLSSKLPPNSVILAPEEIALEKGKPVARPLNQYPPAVIDVDLFAYRYPTKNPNLKAPQTFGDLVSPFITIRTSFQGSPTTFGTISTNELFLNSSGAELNQYFTNRGAQLGEGFSMTLLEYLGQSDRTQPLEIETSSELPRPQNTLLEVPLKNFAMDHDRIERRGANSDSAFTDVLNPFVNIVVDALNQLDVHRATRAKWTNYIAQFDPELAQYYPFENVQPEAKARLDLVNRYSGLERKFLSTKSQEHFKSAYEGDYGKTLREIMARELDYIERKREQASNENLLVFAATMQVLAAAAGAASGQPTDTAATQSQSEELQRLAISLAKQGEGLTAAFEKNFSNIYTQHARQETVMLEGEKQIHVSTLSDLRTKLKQHYRRNTANLPRVIALRSSATTYGNKGPDWLQDQASSCWLNRQPFAADAVRWSGACPAGKADGYGLATFFSGDRYVGEYEGEMRDGSPNGWGMRIAPIPESRRFGSIEGHFASGQPVGVVLVNHPGKDPRYVDYQPDSDKSGGKLAGLLGGFFGGPDDAAVQAFTAEQQQHLLMRLAPQLSDEATEMMSSRQ